MLSIIIETYIIYVNTHSNTKSHVKTYKTLNPKTLKNSPFAKKHAQRKRTMQFANVIKSMSFFNNFFFVFLGKKGKLLDYCKFD
jgi:hypothetical protein